MVDEDGEATDALFYVCREDEAATEIIARNLRDAAMRGTRGTVCAVLVFFSSEGLQAGATRAGRIKEIRAIANLDRIIPDLRESRSDNDFTLINEPESEIHKEADGRNGRSGPHQLGASANDAGLGPRVRG